MADSVRRVNKRAKREKREDDEVTRLEKENRELKAINRSLTKQLKKLAKGIHRQEALETLESIEDNGKEKDRPRGEPACPECTRTGGLRTFEISGRRFERCEHCGYKSGRLK